VDNLGIPIDQVCTPASCSDDFGLIKLLTGKTLKRLKTKPVNTKKIQIIVDNGYNIPSLIKKLQVIYPQIMSKIKFIQTPKISKEYKEKLGLKGFVPVALRWIVERSNSWIDKCKSMLRNFEANFARSEAKIQLCFIRLTIKQLAR
jgi:hypothetical protein